jgi:hypothetical protein
MSARSRVAVLAGLFLVAAVILEVPDARLNPSAPPAVGDAKRTPPPRLSRLQVNRQDRVPEAQRRAAAGDARERPLVSVLPIALGGVRLDLAGVSAGGNRTVITIAPGRRGRAYAAALYRRTLAALGDTGHAYLLRWVR